MKKQTAVEWLMEQILPTISIRLSDTYIKEIKDQAKAMERDQIMIAHYVGSSPRITHNNSIHYYSETYGS
jgi:hypothetical protein